MTKEQVLSTKNWNSEYPNYMAENQILDSMDEWAEIVVIGFGEWLNKSAYPSYDSTDKNCGWNLHSGMDGEVYTTKQLYSMYLNTL